MNLPYNVILLVKHPQYGSKKQIGKVVKTEDGELVYRFHGATIMRTTQTLGVHPAVLNYLLEAKVSRIEYRLSDDSWMATTPYLALTKGFPHTFNGNAVPHFNVPLSCWVKIAPPKDVWVPDKPAFRLLLEWIDPKEVVGMKRLPM